MADAHTLVEFVRGAATLPGALFPADAWACSVCVGWAEDQGLHAGFYWSALLLTVVPFALVGVIGAWMRYAIWRARKPAREVREGGS